MVCANLLTHNNTYTFISYLIPQYPSEVDTDKIKGRQVKLPTSKSHG